MPRSLSSKLCLSLITIGNNHVDVKTYRNTLEKKILKSRFTCIDICGLYDCEENVWAEIHDFPVALYYEAATVLRKHGRDYGWLVSGGECKGPYPS